MNKLSTLPRRQLLALDLQNHWLHLCTCSRIQKASLHALSITTKRQNKNSSSLFIKSETRRLHKTLSIPSLKRLPSNSIFFFSKPFQTLHKNTKHFNNNNKNNNNNNNRIGNPARLKLNAQLPVNTRTLSITTTTAAPNVVGASAVAQPESDESSSEDINSKSRSRLRKGEAGGFKPLPKLATKPFIELAKPELTILVVLTAMSSYAICPFSSSSIQGLLFLGIGSTLCSASANAFNQWTEPPFDAQMARTKNRPIIRGAVSPPQAFTYAVVTGVAGVGTLFLGTNTTTALLGLANIILYAGIYTPMKRMTIANTWVGSIVGAIPPLMGWAACTPEGDLFSSPGGWILAAMLFAWQFPHFNSLSWRMRAEYARAGYRMASVSRPNLNARLTLQYSLAFFPLCAWLVTSGIVSPLYLLPSSIANAYLTKEAWKFWREKSDKNARSLFFASLIHLPVVLCFAMLTKVGLWDGIVSTFQVMKDS